MPSMLPVCGQSCSHHSEPLHFPVSWRFLHPFPTDFLQEESPSLVCGGGHPGTWFLLAPGLGVWVSRCQLKAWTTWEE